MVAITSSSSSSTNGSHEVTPPIYACQDSKPEVYSQKRLSRKQWSVQGEPRTLLKRLRSQLAEDGCPESQLSMAKTLLDHTEATNYEENCQQAVFWLTQASLQGSIEANDLLRKCLDEGIGICEQNYQDVKRCLEMNQQEKLVVVATKNLFTSLAEGNDFVTERKVLAKIYEICKIETCESFDDKSKKCEMKNYQEEKYGSRRLSESSIVGTGLEFIDGRIPSKVTILLPSTRLRTTQDGWHCINYISYLQEFILSNIENNLLQKSSFFNTSNKLLFFSLVLTFLLFLLYSYSLSKFYITTIYCLWFVCFLIMTYSSLVVMIHHKNQKVFYIWAQVFGELNPELDTNVASKKYKNKYFQYYASYFGALLAFLILLPVVDSGIKAFTLPPFCIVSFCLLISCFKSNFSFYILCSCFYFFAHYIEGQIYMKTSIVKHIPWLDQYILDESFHLWNILYLNLDIGSIFHSLWFVSLTFVSLTLGPFGILYHTMSVFWFHLTLLTFVGTFGSWIYISLLFWFIFVLLPQGFHFLSVVVPSLLASLASYSSGLGIIATLSVFILLFSFLLLLSKLNSNLGSIMKYIFIILSFVFLFKQPIGKGSKVSSLKWEQFQNYCLPTKESIDAHTFHDCSRLKGLLIEWQAVVKQIEVDSVVNIPERILSIFPPFLNQHLRCSLSPPVTDCSEKVNEKERERCFIMKEYDECSLNHWNDYQFRMIVVMESNFWKFTKNSEITLMACNEFVSVIRNLSVHDKISFTGLLDEGIGTSSPKIMLSSLRCLECKNYYISSDPVQLILDYKKLSEAFKFSFNFIFGPTLTV